MNSIMGLAFYVCIPKTWSRLIKYHTIVFAARHADWKDISVSSSLPDELRMRRKIVGRMTLIRTHTYISNPEEFLDINMVHK